MKPEPIDWDNSEPELIDWDEETVKESEEEPELVDWNEEIAKDPQEEYEAFLRTLSWTEGFGILFVRCASEEREYLITRVKADLPQKRIETLRLDESTWNLYELVNNLPNKDQLNILFITGIEETLKEYVKPGYGGQGDYYTLDTVPKILNHLNQRRESFRDHFNICFVFLVPLFALKYFIRRAPDFFDWRSGVLEFVATPETTAHETARIALEGGYQEYLKLSHQERRRKIQEIQNQIEANPESPKCADLLFEKGNLQLADGQYEEAIASYDQTLTIKPDFYPAWRNRGHALLELGQFDKAIDSYNQATKLESSERSTQLNQLISSNEPRQEKTHPISSKRNHNFRSSQSSTFLDIGEWDWPINHVPGQVDYTFWRSKGDALCDSGEWERAIDSYNKALKIKSDDDVAWSKRGYALDELGQYEKALASYDRALQINPNNVVTWNNRGITLYELGCYEEAIYSLSEALRIDFNAYLTWFNQGRILSNLKRYDEAIASYRQATKINPVYLKAWSELGDLFCDLEQYEDAIASYDKVLINNPDAYDACTTWKDRGDALQRLERWEEAIGSYNHVLRIKPDNHEVWMNRGYSLYRLGRFDEAVSNCEQALNINHRNYSAQALRGVILTSLQRYDEAINSLDRAIELKPLGSLAYYQKGCCYSLLSNLEEALKNLKQAIELDPEKYREQAKTDPDFDPIRDNEQFQALVNGGE